MPRQITNPHTARPPVIVPASGDPSCALERIHLPGTIQSHGALLVVQPAEQACIIAVSSNAASIFGEAIGAEMLGMPLSDVLGGEFSMELLKRFHLQGLPGSAPWQSVLRLPGSAAVFDVSAHLQDSLILVELEAAHVQVVEEVQASLSELQSIILELRNAGDNLGAAAHVTAKGLRHLAGYERVVIYKFDTDWNGQAIAEDKTDDWNDSLAGLRFPASDIPAQARHLYTKCPVRWVPDRDAESAAIEVDPQFGLPDGGVDLSCAILRSPSPVYLQIHRNLGINGTLSFSIIQNGRLWGLAICHHRQAHRPDASQRAAALALVGAFALRISATEYADTGQARQADLVRMAKLLVHMARSEVVTTALTTGDVTLLDLFASTGAALLYGDTMSAMGDLPPEEDLRALVVWLRTQAGPGNLFQTNNLAEFYRPWMPYAKRASGVLAVFLSEGRPEVLLWFRPEELELVSWGGSLRNGLSGDAFIHPEPVTQWSVMQHGFAKPWDDWELEMAGSLSNDIAKVMIRELRIDVEISTKLRQSQKMEALGQLAGGIAHDFNNILQSVYSAALLVKKHANNKDRMQKYIDFVISAAERGAGVTRRLLTFSHQSVLQAEPINAVSVLADMQEMLAHTIGAAITIRVEVKSGLPPLFADKGQLETALINLVSNARDAMPSGGMLTFAADHAVLQGKNGPSLLANLPPGRYVKLTVSDTGTGMTPAVLAHVSEPFFTTKPIGQGTGLGLAMARGFADQSGGSLQIESELGYGTKVSLWFPVYADAVPPASPVIEAARHATVLPNVAARLLIIDDDAIVRDTVAQQLEDEGFEVTTASNGADALLLLESGDAIDLVITDYSMPDMNGVALIHEIHRRKPLLPTILLTGFMANSVEIAVSGAMTGTFTLLRKPIAGRVLADRIAALLVAVKEQT